MRHLIGLGFRCDVAFQLRMHGKENVAHFFDWLATPIEAVIRIIAADFDVFHADHLELNLKHDPHCIEDKPTGVRFHHQFPLFAGHCQPDFLLHYASFSQKFCHLASRFREFMMEKPVTLVRHEITQEQALRLEDAVSARFPSADVDFLYIIDDGIEFVTPRGRARLLRSDYSSLGDPQDWSQMLIREGLIGIPYRHATAEILGAAHDDRNLSTDNRFTEAQLKIAIATNPESVAYKLELARWYISHGRIPEAEDPAVVALAQSPFHTEALYQLTSVQWRLGTVPSSQAADILVACLDAKEAKPSWGMEASKTLLKANRVDEALICANRALAWDATDQRLYLQKAECLFRKRDFHAIRLTLKAAARLGPLPGVYDQMLANALEADGDLDEALLAVDRALGAGQQFNSLFTKAGILVRMGRLEEALDACRCAMPLSGESRAALESRITEVEARMLKPIAPENNVGPKAITLEQSKTPPVLQNDETRN